jgi:hypothetical protein
MDCNYEINLIVENVSSVCKGKKVFVIGEPSEKMQNDCTFNHISFIH